MIAASFDSDGPVFWRLSFGPTPPDGAIIRGTLCIVHKTGFSESGSLHRPTGRNRVKRPEKFQNRAFYGHPRSGTAFAPCVPVQTVTPPARAPPFMHS